MKYKETFKEATIELNKSLLKIKAGVITDSPVLSVRQIVEELNKKLSPSAPKKYSGQKNNLKTATGTKTKL